LMTGGRAGGAAMSDVQFVFPMGPIARALIAVVLGASAVSLAPSADARITKIVLSGPTPAFANASFGNVGAYEQFDGTAYGEVDPLDPLNALIQDIALAPRNSNGKATYATRVVILRPVQLNQGNGTMLLEIVNRGNKLNPGFFNVGVTTATPQGDGFLEKQGFTLVWVGWQADLVAPTGVDLVTMSAPVAHYSNEDDPITGPVRAEFIVSSPAPSLNIVDNSSSNTPGYATAHRDNSHDTLTMRGHQNDPRVPIPNSNWAYADCSTTPFPGTPNRQKVCLKGGFDSDHIYELLYTARDPIVMGLGLAALRDVGSFLRYAATDDQGTANPLAGAMRYALLNGISQSGRLLRTFLELGFNQDEAHRPVFDGMQPHIGSVRNYINVRFSQPGRLAGTQHTEQQYPGPEGPLTYGDSLDSFTGKQSGLLDRCLATKTCPRIIHTMTDTEYWESSGAFDTVAPDGSADVQIPDNVRIYQFSSTQHGGFSPVAPLSDAAKNNICTQLKNTNSYTYNIRALLVALQQWVASGKTPPDSRAVVPNHRRRDRTERPLEHAVRLRPRIKVQLRRRLGHHQCRAAAPGRAVSDAAAPGRRGRQRHRRRAFGDAADALGDLYRMERARRRLQPGRRVRSDRRLHSIQGHQGAARRVVRSAAFAGRALRKPDRLHECRHRSRAGIG
jgi:hypothetical protein